jgi:hypothetical protein
MSWTARLSVAIVLILAGAAAAAWGLAHYPSAARLFGVAPPPQRVMLTPRPIVTNPPLSNVRSPASAQVDQPDIAQLEARLSRVENASQRAEGSAGRADALLVAFAARRAIDRGVALGYLEPLLVSRFGAQHPRAVATVITGSRQPVRLNDLIAQYEGLAPALRRGGPQESWWAGFTRELGSLVEIRHAEHPSANADARYAHAAQRLAAGEVEQALAETMRLPGAANASDWIAKARRYILVHRGLDEVESAALLGGTKR